MYCLQFVSQLVTVTDGSKSVVWMHVNKLSSRKASCKLCLITLSAVGKNALLLNAYCAAARGQGLSLWHALRSVELKYSTSPGIEILLLRNKILQT